MNKIPETLLPRIKPQVTLGEGKTPTLRFKNNILLKLEYLNPTGSFKDRGASLAISRALSLGKKIVIEDSSGNAGLAVSAYSARAGIKAFIYVPSDIPEGKYRLIKAFGAEVIKAGTRNEAHEKALKDKRGYYIGHTINPFFIEGMKDFFLEILKDVDLLGALFIPVASGSLLLGVWKAINELLELGLIEKIPALITVQACGYSTLDKYVETHYLECTEPSKIADALRLTIVPRIQQIAEAVRKSNGFNVVIGDKEALKALKTLYSNGFAPEPSSSLAFAAAIRYSSEFDGNIIVPLTGSGLKYLPIRSELIDGALFD
jgi:threonine synthase